MPEQTREGIEVHAEEVMMTTLTSNSLAISKTFFREFLFVNTKTSQVKKSGAFERITIFPND